MPSIERILEKARRLNTQEVAQGREPLLKPDHRFAKRPVKPCPTDFTGVSRKTQDIRAGRLDPDRQDEIPEHARPVDVHPDSEFGRAHIAAQAKAERRG